MQQVIVILDGTSRLIQTSRLEKHERILAEGVDLPSKAHTGSCHTQISAQCERRKVTAMRLQTIILILAGLVVLFSSCGVTPQKVSTAAAAPLHLQIATYST